MKGKTVRTILTVLLAVISVLVFVGCSTPPEQFSDYKKSAIKEIESYADSCVFDDKESYKVYAYWNGILYKCKEEINAAENRDEVRTAVNNAKKKIDEIKIDISNRRAISYENNTIDGKFVHYNTFFGRIIIRSYTELEDFCAANNIYEDNKVITDQYNIEFFDKKALVIFCYSTDDSSIKRQVECVYIAGNKLQVVISELVPSDRVTENGDIIYNTDGCYVFAILHVDKSDIGEITDVALTSQIVII